MVNRIVNWEYYALAGVVAAVLLLAGIYFGVTVSKEKMDIILGELDNSKLAQQDIILDTELMTVGNRSCEAMSRDLNTVVNNAETLGRYVSDYENSEKVLDSNFLYTKKDYTLTLVRYWLYVENLKKECGLTGTVTVLYFYSNTDCGDCGNQGFVLDQLKAVYGQNMSTFAIDSNLDLSSVKMLKSIYNVDSVPTLVINDKTHVGFMGMKELNDLIRSELPRS